MKTEEEVIGQNAGRDAAFIIRVIRSCTTTDHIAVTTKLLKNFNMLYPGGEYFDVFQELNNERERRFNEILENNIKVAEQKLKEEQNERN